MLNRTTPLDGTLNISAFFSKVTNHPVLMLSCYIPDHIWAHKNVHFLHNKVEKTYYN